MILKENERMARFKIEEIKEVEIELKGLESELRFKRLILKKLELFGNNILVSKCYYSKPKMMKTLF